MQDEGVMFEGMCVSPVPGRRDRDMTARGRIHISIKPKVLFAAQSCICQCENQIIKNRND
jgi:hypothetical protein